MPSDLSELEARISVIEQILIDKGYLTIDAIPEIDPIFPFVQTTPREQRDAGQPYCPKCYTFGDVHRKDCPYRMLGMAHHVSKKKDGGEKS